MEGWSPSISGLVAFEQDMRAMRPYLDKVLESMLLEGPDVLEEGRDYEPIDLLLDALEEWVKQRARDLWKDASALGFQRFYDDFKRKAQEARQQAEEKAKQYTPATVKEGWEMPAPPEKVCSRCNGKPVAQAYLDVDVWYFFWDCEGDCQLHEEPIDTWPFVEDKAWPQDLKKLGFQIV